MNALIEEYSQFAYYRVSDSANPTWPRGGKFFTGSLDACLAQASEDARDEFAMNADALVRGKLQVYANVTLKYKEIEVLGALPRATEQLLIRTAAAEYYQWLGEEFPSELFAKWYSSGKGSMLDQAIDDEDIAAIDSLFANVPAVPTDYLSQAVTAVGNASHMLLQLEDKTFEAEEIVNALKSFYATTRRNRPKVKAKLEAVFKLLHKRYAFKTREDVQQSIVALSRDISLLRRALSLVKQENI